MGITVEGCTVQRSIETQLNDLLLGGRASLPRTANNRPIPPAPRVANVRKLIVQRMCCPFKHLLEVSTQDVSDGVPLSEVLAPYYRLIAVLETRAAERHIARERPVPVLLMKAEQEINEFELAALRLANSPSSVEAMESVIREAADIGPVLADVERACHLTVVRCSDRRLTLETR